MNNKELTELKKSRKMEVFYDGDDVIRIEMQGKTFIPTTVSVKMSEYAGVDNTPSNDEIKREALQEFRKWFREWKPTFPNSEPESVLMAKGYNLCLHEMGWKAEEYLTQKENNE